MGFWGIEVKPGKPVHYQFSEVEGRVNVTQATLGAGDARERSALQCSIGEAEPVFLCSLLPNKVECCPLNLEFEEDELVSFKVVGPRSVHLSGILLIDGGDEECCDSDSFGEDIAGTDSEESSEYDSQGEYDDEFINDGDLDMLPPSPVRKSGVVIEEIEDDEKPKDTKKEAQQLKKIKLKDSRDAPVLESEDEDGFPVSFSKKPDNKAEKAEVEDPKKQEKDGGDDSTGLKRKIESIEKDGQQESKKKKKKKQKQKEQDEMVKTHDSKPGEESKVLPSKGEKGQKLVNENSDIAPAENGSEKKKKKNKKNKKGQEEENTNMAREQTVTPTGDKQKSNLQLGEETEPSQVRSFPNGLVIEELEMGKPDGKRASPGKQVGVRYIGKLKKNGKIFDSNVGRAPFKFRLGVGQVIKGWDVGVNGMRIGDKRRLTIPPAMGYGSKGAGGAIPPNAWLVFDVELVDVR